VEQTSESVASSEALGINDRNWWCFRLLLRGALAQRTMRTMAVVVNHVLGQYLLKMTTPEDKDPVEALAAYGAHKPFGDRVRARRLDGCLYGPEALGAEPSSKPAVNFVSLSRTRNLTAGRRWARCKVRSRACWVAQSPTGLAVTPEM
jgi:hypothetical protein